MKIIAEINSKKDNIENLQEALDTFLDYILDNNNISEELWRELRMTKVYNELDALDDRLYEIDWEARHNKDLEEE